MKDMKRFGKFLGQRALLMAVALCLSINVFAQDRFQELEAQLTHLAGKVPGLNEAVDFNMNGADVQQFMSGLSRTHGLNIWVDPEVKGRVVNSFTNANVKDVLVLLCKRFNLDIEVQGNILYIGKYVAPPVEPLLVSAKVPEIQYNDQTDFISMNLRNDSIDRVAEEITRKSFKNVIVSPEARGTVIRSVFIQNRPFEKALENMLYTEGLKLVKTRDNFYRIEPDPNFVKPGTGGTRPGTRPGQTGTASARAPGFDYTVENERVTVQATETPIADIIDAISKEMHTSYSLYDVIEDKASLFIDNATYDELLARILNGTEYTYKEQEGVYLIGKRNQEGLRTTKLVRLENRTIETVIDFIPAELKTDVEIKEFAELNGLILSGSYPKIIEIEDFLTEIDQVVPMVMVEVIIVEVNKKKFLKAGLTAGIGGDPNAATTGTFNGGDGQTGGYQGDLNSSTINELIQSFNGFGLINLGNVKPDFYMSISALESDELIKIRSTPRLSTLNGHEANLKIGKTEWYAETTVNTTGNLTAVTQQQRVFKSTNADLSIMIHPYVSSGEMITLDITVDQQDFDPNSPPGQPRNQFSRSFQSQIRVHNGDMILLGGLENKEGGNTSDGLPFVARIPVLKWFFSTTTKTKNKSELNVFIKSTVIY